METKPSIAALSGVYHRYGKKVGLNKADITIHEGEIVSLLGPSGSGKTTLLKIMAGKIRPCKGKVLVNGRVPDLRGRKDWAWVFSDAPKMDCLNIRAQFALRLIRHGIRGENAKNRMTDALELVEMAGCEKAFFDQLSEGENQRLMLARALLLEPKLLILDDPLCKVDMPLRRRIWARLKEWQSNHGAAILFTSSLPEEALAHAHRAALMRNGEIIQMGAPYQLLENPESHFAACYLRQCNVLGGVITGCGENKAALDMDGFTLPCIPRRSVKLWEEMALCVAWNALHFSIRPQGKIFISGVVREFIHGEAGRIAAIQLPGGRILYGYCRDDEDYLLGSRVFLWWNPEEAVLVPWDESVK